MITIRANFSNPEWLRRFAIRMRDLARGVEQNVPRHQNPEAFHEAKSDLTNAASNLADEFDDAIRNAGMEIHR